MAGRGPQTFKKRQKEQQRKEKQAEKLARRLQRKHEKPGEGGTDTDIESVDTDIEAIDADTDRDGDAVVGGSPTLEHS